MHRLLIVIHYTVHRPLPLQQLALAVSLVAVVGVIGDVSEIQRILITSLIVTPMHRAFSDQSDIYFRRYLNRVALGWKADKQLDSNSHPLSLLASLSFFQV